MISLPSSVPKQLMCLTTQSPLRSKLLYLPISVFFIYFLTDSFSRLGIAGLLLFILITIIFFFFFHVILQLTGDLSKMVALQKLLEPYGICEVCLLFLNSSGHVFQICILVFFIFFPRNNYLGVIRRICR